MLVLDPWSVVLVVSSRLSCVKNLHQAFEENVKCECAFRDLREAFPPKQLESHAPPMQRMECPEIHASGADSTPGAAWMMRVYLRLVSYAIHSHSNPHVNCNQLDQS